MAPTTIAAGDLAGSGGKQHRRRRITIGAEHRCGPRKFLNRKPSAAMPSSPGPTVPCGPAGYLDNICSAGLIRRVCGQQRFIEQLAPERIPLLCVGRVEKLHFLQIHFRLDFTQHNVVDQVLLRSAVTACR